MANISGAMKSELKKLFSRSPKDRLKQLKRERSIAILNDEDTSKLDSDIRKLEKNMHRIRGTADTGPR
jgi:hypothetical protein